MQERYLKNLGAISEEEQNLLKKKTAFIAGAGGLGGYIVEFCARFGINIIICDNDFFNTTNLNRQLLCDTSTLGKSKAQTAAEHALVINPNISVIAKTERLTAENALSMLADADIAIDALDNIEARKIVAAAASKKGIAMVSAAVEGWCGQVTTLLPESKALDIVYAGGANSSPGVTACTAAYTASAEFAEVINALLNRPKLAGKLLVLDISEFESRVLSLKGEER